VRGESRLVRGTAESGGLLSCASCATDVTSGAAAARCPDCGALYHMECWNTRTTCATAGCRGYRRALNRGSLTLLPGMRVDSLERAEVPATGPLKVPAPKVELLPAAGYAERSRERRRPGWAVTVAIAFAALAIGVAATLALRHTAEGTRQEKGFRTGWQAGYKAGSTGGFDTGFKKGNQAGWDAGYQRGFQEGCRSSGGADAGCSTTMLPARTGASGTQEGDRRST
jgi:hypothetical protein